MEFTQEFFNYLALLTSLMFAFTAFKIATCKPFKDEGPEFELKKFLLGLAEKFIVLFGVMIVFVTSCKCGEELVLIEIAGAQLTIHAAIKVTILAVVAVWGVKFVKNLAEYFGLGKKFTDQVHTVPLEDISNGQSNCDPDGCNCSCGCRGSRGKLIGYLYAPGDCICCENEGSENTECLECDQTEFNEDESVCDGADSDEVVG